MNIVANYSSNYKNIVVFWGYSAQQKSQYEDKTFLKHVRKKKKSSNKQDGNRRALPTPQQKWEVWDATAQERNARHRQSNSGGSYQTFRRKI